LVFIHGFRFHSLALGMLRTMAGVGAQLKMPAATSSKIKPQSHQNVAAETPLPRKAAR
jgi:hypothetical protein